MTATGRKGIKEQEVKTSKVLVVITEADIIPEFYKKTKIKLNVMISYQYLRGQATKVAQDYRHMIDSLYLDSGAYSASKGQSRITVPEYSGYLKKFGGLFDVVFNFDNAFDDPDNNWRNQVRLEKDLEGTGIKPVPVVHDPKDPFEEFKMYAESGHDYIAIGSNKRLPDAVFNKIKNEFPNVRIHLFGTLARSMLFKHKPYSADSSVYARQAGFGKTLYWDPIDKKEYTLDLGTRRRKTLGPRHIANFHHKRQQRKFWKNAFEYTYQDLLTDYKAQKIVNMYFMWQLECRLNESE